MSEAWFKTRRRLIGVVFLAVLGLLVSLSVAIFNKQFTSATMVTLYTDSTGNQMNLNADVMVRGVVVGEVRSITAYGNGAKLGLALQPSAARALPANVTAQMLPTTLFGQRYVNLVVPATPSTATLAEQPSIGQDRSGDAIELERVLNDLEPMLTAVQPQKLSVTLSVMADALQGNGSKLGQTLDEINSYLRQFDPQLPALDNDIRELVQVTRTYAQAAPGIVQALHDFSITSQTVASEAANLRTLYATVTGTSQNLTTFLRANSGTIISLSANSEQSLRTLARYSAEFPCVFAGLNDFIPNINKALGKGTSQPGLRVTVHVLPARVGYRPNANTPRYGDDLGAHCYSAPFRGIGLNDGSPNSPAASLTTSPGVGSGQGAGSLQVPAGGLGLPNSPQENELVNELLAPGLNMSPGQLPSWSSVLLGPLYRGTTVSVG